MSTLLHLKSLILQAEALEMDIGDQLNRYMSLLRKQRGMVEDAIKITEGRLRVMENSIRLAKEEARKENISISAETLNPQEVAP